MPALLALLGAAVFGAADFVGGHATRRTPVATVTLLSNLVGAGLAGLLVVAVGGVWSTSALSWGALGGFFGLAGLVLLYLGLADGPNRLVSPLCAVIAAVIPVLVGIGGGDRPGTTGTIGLASTVPAIWLVAGGELHLPESRRSVRLAVGSGVGFGLFFVCLAQTPDDAGAVPLLAARVASTALLLGAAARRHDRRPAPSELSLPALAGVLDMTANGLFLWSTRDGDLAVVGALINLFPITTVVLARIVLAERLTRSQAVGIVLAVAAAALLA